MGSIKNLADDPLRLLVEAVCEAPIGTAVSICKEQLDIPLVTKLPQRIQPGLDELAVRSVICCNASAGQRLASNIPASF